MKNKILAFLLPCLLMAGIFSSCSPGSCPANDDHEAQVQLQAQEQAQTLCATVITGYKQIIADQSAKMDELAACCKDAGTSSYITPKSHVIASAGKQSPHYYTAERRNPGGTAEKYVVSLSPQPTQDEGDERNPLIVTCADINKDSVKKSIDEAAEFGKEQVETMPDKGAPLPAWMGWVAAAGIGGFGLFARWRARRRARKGQD